MTRKTFLIRHVKSLPPDEDTAGKYLLHWHGRDLYFAPQTFPRLTSQDIFGNDKPLEIEVGCSTGEFICAIAKERSECNFVGIDINLKSLYMAIDTASGLLLENIRFVKAAVQYLYPLMSESSLQGIYLHFPDPYLHPKYRKQRIFNSAFLDAAHYSLIPGGKLSVVTDNQELFASMLPQVEKDSRFRRTHKERYVSGFEPSVKSRYQEYWEAHGAAIYRLEVSKSG